MPVLAKSSQVSMDEVSYFFCGFAKFSCASASNLQEHEAQCEIDAENSS